MATTKLGRVMPVDKGDYSASTEYSVLDMVHTVDSTYVSKVDNNIGHAVTDTNYWQCYASGVAATEAAEAANEAAEEAHEAATEVVNIVKGYYHQGSFYEDEEHETEITPSTSKVYIDRTEGAVNQQYLWNGEEYEAIKIDSRAVEQALQQAQTAVANAQTALDNANEALEDVTDLKDQVEAYIGMGKETVVVSVSSSVSGVSVEGLVLNVYLNNSTTPDQYTTDEDGMVAFRVDSGYTYRIVFPEVEGCAPIADVTHVASVAQRSIEVEYVVAPELVEHLRVRTRLYTSSAWGVYANRTVHVTIGSTTTDYTTDENGELTVNIPLGSTYTVSVDQVSGKYIQGYATYTYLAQKQSRIVFFSYHDMEVGIYLVDKQGVNYTYDEWVASGKGPEDTDFMYIANANLISHDGAFYVKHDDIANKVWTNKTWQNPNNVALNNIPLNGNSSSAEFYYDGLGATTAIVDECAQRGIVCDAASFAYGKTAQLTTDNTLQGFMMSVGQDRVINDNINELNALFALARPEATNNYTTMRAATKWTSTQQSATNAYYCGASVLSIGKNGSNAVFTAYAQFITSPIQLLRRVL